MKPKHKVVTRSPHRPVGLVPCSWLQREPIEYESQLEYRCIKKLLLTPGVIHIKAQPFQIVHGEQSDHGYTPDFLVKFDYRSDLVIEVKPLKYIERQRQLFNTVDEILQREQLSLCVATEIEIDQGDSIEEISLILRYAKGCVENDSIMAVKKLFLESKQTALSIGEISRFAKVRISDVLHMLGRKILYFKDQISTEQNTIIVLNQKDINHDNICISNWLDATAWRTNPRIHTNDQFNRSSIRRRNNTPSLHMDDFKSHS